MSKQANFEHVSDNGPPMNLKGQVNFSAIGEGPLKTRPHDFQTITDTGPAIKLTGMVDFSAISDGGAPLKTRSHDFEAIGEITGA